MLWFFIVMVAYMLGSVPMGVILTKIFGYGDLRRVGSGNIGATNVMRVGGLRIAGLVSGKSSAGALVVFGLFPILGWVMNPGVGLAFLATSALCAWRHVENIRRLAHGTESSIEWRWRK